MAKKSAGILLYRFRDFQPEVLLAHPGGPFWAKKDDGVWSIPKGEFTDEEDTLDAAKREFYEETGTRVSGDFIPLSPFKHKDGKVVYAFALEGDFDVSQLTSNTFKIEWPPKSGKHQEFPEIDRAGWFDFDTCKVKLYKAQAEIIDELAFILKQKQLK
jgi:predicted NUDIX family NTP pyrophosphohydrolase